MKFLQTQLFALAFPLLGAACSSESPSPQATDTSPTTTASTENPGAGGTPGVPTTTATGTSTVPVFPVDLPTNGALGPIALRRLNTPEYENTVQDLLKVAPGTTRQFRDDDASLGYKNIAAALTVTPLLAERYAITARTLANTLDVAKFAPCAAGGTETMCAEAFIQSFGRGAFRRPITNEELTGYSAIFSGEQTRSNYAGGIRLVAEAMLQSPHFLYKTEIGEGSGVDRKLTAYELATQLSYLMTGSMPDAELAAAAETAKLEVPSEREAHVRRLLGTPRGMAWFTTFVTQWLGIADAGYVSKDQGAFPTYTGSLSVAITEESTRFIGRILTQSNGSLETLLTANWTLANPELGTHYGLAQAPTDWQQVTLPVDQRLGILTQPAFLVATSKARESFPMRRGKSLRSRILCGDVPPPPPELMVQFTILSDDLTTREALAAHGQAGSSCAACHSLIDPLGLAFENYDATGAYRTKENDRPIDASGAINAISPEIDGPFANALEFAKRIAPSQVLKACVAREALRWSIGRETVAAPSTDPNVIRDQVMISVLAARLSTNNSDIRELPVALVLRDEFGFRSDK